MYDDLIIRYFREGFNPTEITAALVCRHGISKSLSQVKRRLKVLQLRRRGIESPLDNIIEAVQYEISHSGRSMGINMMWRHLRNKYNLLVKRNTVRDVMDILLPGELMQRRSRRLIRRLYYSVGPNFMVHVDQYDKLSSYGFFIHGAIDGFSRKMLWLNVGNTNRNSSTVAHFYLKFAIGIGGVPKLLRVDGGTENSLMLDIHTLLRQDGQDRHARSPYIIGKSVHNQRIERWWGFLRSHFTQYWMDFFFQMMMAHLYNPHDEINYQLLQFCFTPLLQKELNDVKDMWNGHKVRRSSQAQCPGGIPNVMFNIPELYNAVNCRQEIPNQYLEQLDNLYGMPLLEYGCNDEFALLCLQIMDIHGFSLPNSSGDALTLYGQLLQIFDTPTL